MCICVSVCCSLSGCGAVVTPCVLPPDEDDPLQRRTTKSGVLFDRFAGYVDSLVVICSFPYVAAVWKDVDGFKCTLT